MPVVVHTSSPSQTQAAAALLSAVFGDGDLVVLAGDLGAGKTCFTQGVAVGLGIEGRVTSPTFTLHNRYEGSIVLNHLDVYRLDDLEETLDLDLPVSDDPDILTVHTERLETGARLEVMGAVLINWKLVEITL